MKLEQALEIQAKLDGQLEPSRDREVERWLREDASASALRDELLAVRKAIREHEPAAAVPESREFYWSQIQRRIAAEAAIESRGAKGGSLVSWIRWLAPALGVAALAVIVTLLAAIVAFEVDIRLFSDWKLRAAASPFWPVGVLWSLGIHLVFAVSTLVLLTWVVWEAVRRFPSPPEPGSHGPRHRRMARLAALDLMATAVTGVIFYWLAFVS